MTLLDTEIDMTRAHLDQQMAAVLVQLALCSHVPAAGYQPTSRSGATSSRILTGDTGACWYRDQYAKAPTDHKRVELIEQARAEVRHLRGHGLAEVARPVGETDQDRRERLLCETEGDSPAEVAQSRHAINERTLRKWRREDGRNLETGYRTTEKLAPLDRRRRALELAGQGLNREQIARRLGEHSMTISRDLASAA